MAHAPEPLLHAHPDDAPAPDGALVRVASTWGAAVLRLRHDTAQQPGQLFAPMHWTDIWAAGARINAAVNPHTDPVSGQPELKHTPVALEPFIADWHGFVLSYREVDCEAAWRARVPLDGGVWRRELAGHGTPPMTALRGALAEPGATWITLDDAATGLHRAALLRDGRLLAVVFLGPDHLLPPRDWLASLFALPAIGSAARRSLLAGRPSDGPPPSPTICICHGVSQARIEAAILAGHGDIAAVGVITKAGTGCGSCRPEIAGLCAAAPVTEPA